MSNSDRLRKTQTRDGGGRSMYNEGAKKLDSDVRTICKEVIFPEIQKEYSSYTFAWEPYIPKMEIAKKALGKLWRSYQPQSDRSTGPRPDGGIIYIVDSDGSKYPVLIVEAKKQGTNNKRIKEGMKRQAKGNAIERVYKNWEELKIFFKNLGYYPFVVFAYGCDFEEGSSINDRLDAMTQYHPRNVDYTLDKDPKATIYIQEEEFTGEEIYKHLKRIVVKCIDHVIDERMIADYATDQFQAQEIEMR